MKPRLIVITGPTASGKSALAVEAALRLGTEVISADSRQIYRHMPIVTAVPDMTERRGVKHHLMECLEPDEYYSAARFEEDALAIARRLWGEGRRDVVVCGGSMMYVDALCHGIDPLPTVPDNVRETLKRRVAELGTEWLLAQLALLDPVTYDSIDRANLKRVFHAVEISQTAGCPYSELCTGTRRERPFEVLKLCVDLPRDILFGRINARVDRMVDMGLEEEARSLYPLKGLNSVNTVGLKEMFAYFDGEMQRDVALARIAKNTRVYAKKQMTWFRRDPECRWMSPDDIRRLLDTEG